MKKAIALALTALMLSLSLAACDGNEEQSKPITEASQPEQSAPEQSDEAVSDTEESGEQAEVMDFKSYLNYFANYFHYPRKAGDSPVYQDILTLVGRFCYENSERLDFVTLDEASSKMTVIGEGMRKTAKNLFGEGFNAEKYHKYFANNSAGNSYDEQKDVYTFATDRASWGGASFYINAGKEHSITEEENGATAIFSIQDSRGGNVADFIYHFEKVTDDGLVYYRIGDVYWNTDPVVTDTWHYTAQVTELGKYGEDAEKYSVSMELPYYLKDTEKGIFFFNYRSGTYFGYGDSFGDLPGFGIRGIYKVDADFVMDKTVANKINDYLGQGGGMVNKTLLYSDPDTYDILTGKTADGNDYVLYIDKATAEAVNAYGYVRASDDSVVYLNFSQDSNEHRDYIIAAVESVRLGDGK